MIARPHARSLAPASRLLVMLALVAGLLSLPSGPASAAASGTFVRMVGLSYWASTKSPQPSDAYVRSRAREAARFMQSLGANTVLLSFPLFTDDWQSNAVWAGTDPADYTLRTPTPREVATSAAALRAAGLDVVLRPLLNEKTLLPDHWRGSLSPSRRGAWFRSYWQAISPYLAAAQLSGAKGFDIQSELQSLVGDSHWTKIIDGAHQAFAGDIVWNPDYLNNQASLMARPGTSLALDFYPTISLPDSASVGQLASAMAAWVRSSPAPQSLLSTAIAEVGIPAQQGMYPTPWKHSSPNAFDQSIQANWFAAACQFAKESGMAGVSFWTAFMGKLPSWTTPNTADPTQLQPASLAAIRACFMGTT